MSETEHLNFRTSKERVKIIEKLMKNQGFEYQKDAINYALDLAKELSLEGKENCNILKQTVENSSEPQKPTLDDFSLQMDRLYRTEIEPLEIAKKKANQRNEALEEQERIKQESKQRDRDNRASSSRSGSGKIDMGDSQEIPNSVFSY